MNATVRRSAYALAAAVSALLALVVVTSTQADAAGPASTVRSKYFTAGEARITCPSGWEATGGGVGADETSTMRVTRTEPLRNSAYTPIGWKADVRTSSGRAGSGTIYVICAR
ncbi:hypothetical protein OHT76_01410 [Streptomyces sp. NBC_00287]|uniref:hypothetical protein n=1 Tax=Streptomyces sp. NBC_00287 TaxID=2975702 RepID=UPI002E286973|nr:hypothetical protein [Streptomyces sp. NBC_00287]